MRHSVRAPETVPNNTSPNVNWELLLMSGLNLYYVDLCHSKCACYGSLVCWCEACFVSEQYTAVKKGICTMLLKEPLAKFFKHCSIYHGLPYKGEPHHSNTMINGVKHARFGSLCWGYLPVYNFTAAAPSPQASLITKCISMDSWTVQLSILRTELKSIYETQWTVSDCR